MISNGLQLLVVMFMSRAAYSVSTQRNSLYLNNRKNPSTIHAIPIRIVISPQVKNVSRKSIFIKICSDCFRRLCFPFIFMLFSIVLYKFTFVFGVPLYHFSSVFPLSKPITFLA